jgi:predicted porin
MKTIALAVAGLMISGAALAQSNVTLYGIIAADYAYSKSDYKKFSGIDDGRAASRLGVKGTEDLGNGLKAIFDVQWRLRTDSGEFAGVPANSRWAWVGLAGNFGTVRAGRLRQPSDEWFGDTSSNGFNATFPVNNMRSRLRVMDGGRWNNAVSYHSPNFSGFNFMTVYAFGEKVSRDKNSNGSCAGTSELKCADISDGGRLAFGARYVNGPVTLMAMYEAISDDNSAKPYTGTSNAGFGTKGWGIGGAYDFKVVKVFANYTSAKANSGGEAKQREAALRAAGATDIDIGNDKQSIWSVGFTVPVSSAGTFMFEYAQYKDYLGGSYTQGGATNYWTRYTADLNGTPGSKAKSYGIGYNHALSKRTSVYALASRFSNDRGIETGVGSTKLPGEDQTNFLMGMRHDF